MRFEYKDNLFILFYLNTVFIKTHTNVTKLIKFTKEKVIIFNCNL